MTWSRRCGFLGHDWSNRSVVYQGKYGDYTYKTYTVSFEDDESGITERGGVWDFCFRCGKEKWRPNPDDYIEKTAPSARFDRRKRV